MSLLILFLIIMNLLENYQKEKISFLEYLRLIIRYDILMFYMFLLKVYILQLIILQEVRNIILDLENLQNRKDIRLVNIL